MCPVRAAGGWLCARTSAAGTSVTAKPTPMPSSKRFICIDSSRRSWVKIRGQALRCSAPGGAVSSGPDRVALDELPQLRVHVVTRCHAEDVAVVAEDECVFRLA